MIFGNKKTIGFDLLGKSGTFINMNIFVNSINISYQDNSYYIYPLMLNLKKEIDYFSQNDLSLDESVRDLKLIELYETFNLNKKNVYRNNKEYMDILYYDLAVKRAFFYAYQEHNELVIFGKFFDEQELITTRVIKNDYISVLSELLFNIELVREVNE